MKVMGRLLSLRGLINLHLPLGETPEVRLSFGYLLLCLLVILHLPLGETPELVAASLTRGTASNLPLHLPPALSHSHRPVP